jgi:8-oxo-dGTP pyrophosphatase MutT (NUDIX family)
MFGWSKKTQPGFQNFLGFPLAYEVSVGGVIFRRTSDGVEYLLLRYPHGHWDYVKGHIEAGETHEETLRRETQEESGLDHIDVVKGFRKYTRYFYTAKGTELVKRKRAGDGIWIFKTVYFYLAEAHDAEIALSDEHIAFAWLPFEEAINKLTFPAAKDILESADAFLKS